MSIAKKDFESIGKAFFKFTLDIGSQNRTFNVEIEKYDSNDDCVVCDFKLNSHEGKCVVINEQTSDETQQIKSWDVGVRSINKELEQIPSDLVLSISDPISQNVKCSGGKGASLGSLYQLALNTNSKFIVPKGIIVTTNSYSNLLNELSKLTEEIKALEQIAWY